MKKIIILLAATVLLAACQSDEEEAQQRVDTSIFTRKCKEKSGHTTLLREGYKGPQHTFCVIAIEPYGDKPY